MSRILVLRPEPAASETVRRARALGLQADAVPLFEIESIPWDPPEPSGFDGLLLTSANAVRRGGQSLRELRGLKAYAVGEATGDAAREAGFDVAATGDAGVDRLLGSIEPDLRLLHLCGANRREPRGARQAITAIPVYKAKFVEKPDLKSASGAVILIHSPRAGRRFAELVKDRDTITIAAISQPSAEVVGSGWRRVAIADSPREDALLALAARLCNKPDPQ